MLPRRALKVVLVCIVAIWALAGVAADQVAYAAATPSQTSQTLTGSSGGQSTAGRDLSATTVTTNGDPDHYTNNSGSQTSSGSDSGGTPRPTQPPEVVIIVLVILCAWLTGTGH